jgi:hypothetical protein
MRNGLPKVPGAVDTRIIHVRVSKEITTLFENNYKTPGHRNMATAKSFEGTSGTYLHPISDWNSLKWSPIPSQNLSSCSVLLTT